MPFNPGVSWFVPFLEHDPLKDDRCIYFTQKRARCLWRCQERDNQRAIELYDTIIGLPVEAVGVELIKEYVLCNCCRSGLARHRDRIEDVGLWIPLAERWLDEIYGHATKQQHSHIASESPESFILPGAVIIPATPIPSHATTAYSTPTTGSPSSQPSTRAFSSASTTPLTFISSPSEYPDSSPKTPTSRAGIASLPSADQINHNQSHLDTNILINAISVRPATISQPPLSEFRPHVAEPGPADSVSSRIGDILVDRDFEIGSLYMFDRDSSPGHVKIGWTAVSVESRLESWSQCEYIPNLLFSVDDVPHAQRAETLTHYELIKEWRRERQCKAQHCGKSHQEWFEISEERAKEVLGGWAEVMKTAEPYDSQGFLKPQWRDFVTRTAKGGEAVTAKKLLEHHELSLAKDVKPPEESIDSVRALKIQEQTDDGNMLKLEELDEPTKAPAPRGSPRMDQSESSKEALLYRDNASPELSRKTSAPFLSNPLPETESFIKIEPLHEDVLAESTSADKELSLAQIKLALSLIIRPIDPQDARPIQVSDPDPSPEIGNPSAREIITRSKTSPAVTFSSEPNLLKSSATLTSKPKAKPVSSSPTSQVAGIPGEQEQSTMPTSITQSQHNEEDGEARHKSELIIRDG